MGMATRTQYQHLAPDPKSSYRQLCVKGTRIRARTLYGLHVNSEEPRTVAEIATDYEISVAAVEEAIAYCHSSPPEIQQDFQHEEALMQAAGSDRPDYRLNPKPNLLTPREVADIQRRNRA